MTPEKPVVEPLSADVRSSFSRLIGDVHRVISLDRGDRGGEWNTALAALDYSVDIAGATLDAARSGRDSDPERGLAERLEDAMVKVGAYRRVEHPDGDYTMVPRTTNEFARLIAAALEADSNPQETERPFRSEYDILADKAAPFGGEE